MCIVIHLIIYENHSCEPNLHFVINLKQILEWDSVTYCKVAELMKNLKPRKSSGLDAFPGELLKAAPNLWAQVLRPMVYIYTTIMMEIFQLHGKHPFVIPKR